MLADVFCNYIWPFYATRKYSPSQFGKDVKFGCIDKYREIFAFEFAKLNVGHSLGKHFQDQRIHLLRLKDSQPQLYHIWWKL